MAANDLMLFYRSEEQNREKMANTAYWTLGTAASQRAPFSSIFLASSFLSQRH
jgi:hypothetical protein